MSESQLNRMCEEILQQAQRQSLTAAACSEFLDQVPKFTEKHAIADTREFLDRLSRYVDETPEAQPLDAAARILHVAGTNGKGSVCCYLTRILMEAGYQVGTFISPHLVHITERFLLNGEPVAEQEFVESFLLVLRFAMENKGEDGSSFPTYFEFLFLIAMVLYYRKPVDFLILETGLGGRLDATNCVRHPELCVITEIGLDHMWILGDTLEEIAAEKAGIIQRGVPVVFADRGNGATNVILEKAAACASEAIPVSRSEVRDVRVDKTEGGALCIDFSCHSRYDKWVNLCLHTGAVYQTENAALAMRAAEELGVSEESVQKGLEKAFWEGRMEALRPGLYADGAHNADGVRAFLESVRLMCAATTDSEERELPALLFGVVMDKQYPQMLKMVLESGCFGRIAITGLRSGRSVQHERWDDVLPPYHSLPEDGRMTLHDSVQEALAALTAENPPEHRTIFAAGSLYLVGQLKEICDDQF